MAVKPKSIRLEYFDYKSNGAYFITICTDYRRPYLKSQSLREIVVAEFTRLQDRFKGVSTDIIEIMPDHIHFVIWLEDSPASLPQIMQAYKSITTLQTKRKGFESKRLWQPNYYEHVIRNEKALERIREYIRNNPLELELPWKKLDL